MDTVALKKALRKKLLATRRALSPEDVAAKSRAIFDQWLVRFTLKPVSHFHVFQSIVQNNEVDTRHFIDYSRTRHPHVALVVPVVDPIEGVLRHAAVSEEVEMVENRWGIPEPKVPLRWVYPMQMDMVIVPMLAFDMAGNRLGYGKGFYDKFLALTRPNCLKIGVCFELGKQEHPLPTDAYDIPMDFVITESGIYRFNENLSL